MFLQFAPVFSVIIFATFNTANEEITIITTPPPLPTQATTDKSVTINTESSNSTTTPTSGNSSPGATDRDTRVNKEGEEIIESSSFSTTSAGVVNESCSTVTCSNTGVPIITNTTTSAEQFTALPILNEDKSSNTSAVFINETQHEQDYDADASLAEPCHSPSDAVLPKVLVGGDDGVYWANMKPTRMTVPVYRKGLYAYSVDYHYQKNYLFFTAFQHFIIRMSIRNFQPAGNVKRIVRADKGAVQIAVDWVKDEIYWIYETHSVIEKADLDGGNRTIIFTNMSMHFDYPRNLVIDPYFRCLFLVDFGTIFRFDLKTDKYKEVKLSVGDQTNIEQLALDRHNRRLYFTKTNRYVPPRLASSTYEGGDLRDHVMLQHYGNVLSLDVYREMVFFADNTEQKYTLYVKNINKENETAREIFIPPKSETDILGVKVYHANLQSEHFVRLCLEEDNE